MYVCSQHLSSHSTEFLTLLSRFIHTSNIFGSILHNCPKLQKTNLSSEMPYWARVGAEEPVAVGLDMLARIHACIRKFDRSIHMADNQFMNWWGTEHFRWQSKGEYKSSRIYRFMDISIPKSTYAAMFVAREWCSASNTCRAEFLWSAGANT